MRHLDLGVLNIDALPASKDLIIGEDGLARPVWAAYDPLLRHYYDNEWGYEVRTEQGLFERLALECFQAGLSWLTILRKRDAFRQAFADFDPDSVAAFTDHDVQRLLNDDRIVRNKAKIAATIHNAQAVLSLRNRGGLVDFLWSFQPSFAYRPTELAQIPTQSPESMALSRALKQNGFRFVGPTTMFALMEATGIVNTHLVGSHRRRR